MGALGLAVLSFVLGLTAEQSWHARRMRRAVQQYREERTLRAIQREGERLRFERDCTTVRVRIALAPSGGR